MTKILIPVKDVERAKERLAVVLSTPERRALAMAMLEDVLEVARATPGHAGIAVVTSDPEATAIARGAGAEVIAEDGQRSESASVDFAATRLERRGVGAILVIPGDAPLVTVAELSALLAAAFPSPPCLVLAPSRDGRGSNGVLKAPPLVIPSRFGEDSRRLHTAEAAARGVPVRLLDLPGLALDIDTPEDLAEFLSRESATRTAKVLGALGFPPRLTQRTVHHRAHRDHRDGV
jgi:2-phospho-L-lactate guanylyltransferase